MFVAKATIMPKLMTAETKTSTQRQADKVDSISLESKANIQRDRKYSRGGGASLVAQWLRIRLPMQGTQVQALVREDPTCRGATKLECHNY